MIVVVGAGIWGLTIAERASSLLGESVLIIEKRNHIGGNCYSYIDEETGIECHKYGSHIFHTSIEGVWKYLLNFTEFTSYRHKVLACAGNRIFSMPINLATINNFFNINLKPYEVNAFLEKEITTNACDNLENQAISLIGKNLYEAFIKGYTQKQWGCPPSQLPSSIITRLPVRSNYNSDYFSDTWQGIPSNGYQEMFENMVKNPKISVLLNTDYKQFKDNIPHDAIIFYSGMIDELHNYKFGALSWRSLDFEWEKIEVQDFQGTSVINYVDGNVPFTRIHEFKHYHPEWEEQFMYEKSIICREYPQEWDTHKEAYYPVNDDVNNELYKKYECEIKNQSDLTIIAGGRLGAYRYWDMDKAVANALDTFENSFRANSR